ncbi:hypothetical protein R3I94_014328 [Phoxinus phoxinus]|uniref:Uncharacterized protein n=1 Tax=Phoxinus phoxinus TaxID=58324 RepID=A0AAN9CT02_9TELE
MPFGGEAWREIETCGLRCTSPLTSSNWTQGGNVNHHVWIWHRAKSDIKEQGCNPSSTLTFDEGDHSNKSWAESTHTFMFQPGNYI